MRLKKNVRMTLLYLAFVVIAQYPFDETFLFYRTNHFRCIGMGKSQLLGDISRREPRLLTKATQKHPFVQAKPVSLLKSRFKIGYRSIKITNLTKWFHTYLPIDI